MAVCSKCGVTVQDQNLQPDAEGKLVCRTCAGAWRGKSGQMSASPARQDSSPGFWMPLALAASALCVLLLIIAIAVGAGKSKLKKDLEGQLASRDNSLKAARIELSNAQDDVRRYSTQVMDLEAKLKTTEQELADLKAKKPLKPGEKPVGPGPVGPGPVGPGPVVSDTLYVNATGATVYHLKGCKGLKAGSKVITPEDAKKKKLKPCPLCKPAAL